VLHEVLESALRQAVLAVIPDAQTQALLVRPTTDPQFGDYQCNALMNVAKARKMNPRQLATDVRAKLDVAQWCDTVEVAGPGFLNFHLKPEALGQALMDAAQGKNLFFTPAEKPRTIVVDFSSPNVAKAMHVGHIRSTILGDCLTRTLRLLGHKVITDNHLGDWGTQFGKLLVGWKERLDSTALSHEPLSELERLYKEVHAASEQDPAVLDRARQELVKLQNGDPENLRIWQQMIRISRQSFDRIYHRLGVKFDHTLGESFYNPLLKDVVADLQQKGIATESEGALVAFFEGEADAELKGTPAIIQKRDGAANYTTTDLATLQHRLKEWNPQEIVYVTDSRQQLHFKQLFAIFRRWHPEADVRLAHVWFGMILRDDGKPFKTKSGENIKLSELLDEAEERALAVVTEKNPDWPEADRREAARIIGLGSIKYSDLLPNRQSDYVFSWEKMLALNGNTAPYLLYAYTRIRSIFRKGASAEAETKFETTGFVLRAPEELRLAKHLLNFGLSLQSVADEYRPNYLCNYLYDLAGYFAQFYEACPVLKAEGDERATRLGLLKLTGDVLKTGLNTLGLETIERM